MDLRRLSYSHQCDIIRESINSELWHEAKSDFLADLLLSPNPKKRDRERGSTQSTLPVLEITRRSVIGVKASEFNL